MKNLQNDIGVDKMSYKIEPDPFYCGRFRIIKVENGGGDFKTYRDASVFLRNLLEKGLTYYDE